MGFSLCRPLPARDTFRSPSSMRHVFDIHVPTIDPSHNGPVALILLDVCVPSIPSIPSIPSTSVVGRDPFVRQTLGRRDGGSDPGPTMDPPLVASGETVIPIPPNDRGCGVDTATLQAMIWWKCAPASFGHSDERLGWEMVPRIGPLVRGRHPPVGVDRQRHLPMVTAPRLR